jgi:hypothetical protein
MLVTATAPRWEVSCLKPHGAQVRQAWIPRDADGRGNDMPLDLARPGSRVARLLPFRAAAREVTSLGLHLAGSRSRLHQSDAG